MQTKISFIVTLHPVGVRSIVICIVSVCLLTNHMYKFHQIFC